MSEWRIWMESSPVPTEEWSDRVDTLLEELEAESEILGPVGWGTGNSLGAVFEVEAEGVEEASRIALRGFGQALAGATKGLDDAAVLRFEISRSEFEPLALLGASDVARVLGVSRQRVYQLLQSFTDFPRPTAQLARGAVWSRREIEAWRDRRGAPVPWVIELVMRVMGAPPRVRTPSQEQMRRMLDEMLHLTNPRGQPAKASWRNDRELWARFTIDAVSERAARESAAHLVKYKAQHGAEIANPDDLDVEITKVEPVAQP